MKLKVLPAVHLEHGRLLDAPGGGSDRESLTTLARGFGEAYVVDVAGVRRNRPDLEFLRDVSRLLPVWCDAGSRYATDAMDVLVAGATRLTVRWSTIRSRDEIAELAEIGDPETLYLGLEFGEKGFLPGAADRGASPEAVAREATALGLPVVVMSPRFDGGLARRFAATARWWYGFASRFEATELERLGYEGLVFPAATARDFADVGAARETDDPEERSP